VHEFRIRRADGTQAWLGHRGQAEYDADGHPLRNFGVAMDITERKQAEAMLREADQKKDHFIAVLAHELRNPLAPIRNAIHVLRHAGSADPTTAAVVSTTPSEPTATIAGGPTATMAGGSSTKLPYTGYDAWTAVGFGLTLVAGGAALRWHLRTRRT